MKRYLILGILWCTPLLPAHTTMITHLFHHKTSPSHHAIERAVLSLYLTKKPSITVSSEQEGVREKTIYFLPDTRLKADLKELAARIANEENLPYQIQVQEVTTPERGVQIILAYDPKQIGITYAHFDAITLQKGIMFRLLDKRVLARLQSARNPIIKTAANVPRVVIDCGHGGHDLGATGCHNLLEKDINLQVGLQVAALLGGKQVEVDLVRSHDQVYPLDERTTFANMQDARLFISIHANAAENRSASGIETHYLAPILCTARDGTLSVYETMLTTKHMQEKCAQGKLLAHAVHHALLQAAQPYQIIDRSCKQSVAQVLLGTTMPAILIELGFITNEKEAALLMQKQYQATLAQGIAQGIMRYLTIA